MSTLSMPRHMHRPWRISRWMDYAGDQVTWELHTGVCPRCPECDGEGGWWEAGPCSEEEPETVVCPRCSRPLVSFRMPAWLDRMIPGSPTRFEHREYDDPPF